MGYLKRNDIQSINDHTIMDRYDCARILSLHFNTITQYKYTAYSHDTHYTMTIRRNSWIKIGVVGGAAVAIVGGEGVAVVGGSTLVA